MDYSPKELLLHPGEKKSTSCSTRIFQVALAMLIITTCIVLLVAPTAFVTIFLLESFQPKSVDGNSNQPSVFISKLLPQLKDKTLQPRSALEYEDIHVNVPDAKIDQFSDQLDISNNKKQEPIIRFKRSNSIEKLSAKDIKLLIEVLNSVQYHGQQVEDIPEEYQNKLNYLMDSMGIGSSRKKRSSGKNYDTTYQESKDNEIVGENKDDYSINIFQESTLYRLLSILDNIQSGGIGLEEIDEYDRDTLNYFMDLEGL